MNYKDYLTRLKKIIVNEEKAIGEIEYFLDHLKNAYDKEERDMVFSHIIKLKNSLNKANNDIPKIIDNISLIRPLYHKGKERKEPEKKEEKEPEKKERKEKRKEKLPKTPKKIKTKKIKRPKISKKFKEFKFSKLEQLTIKRLKKKGRGIITGQIKKPSKYSSISNRIFSNLSRKLLQKDAFILLGKDVIKTNLEFTPLSYISVMLFTTLISLVGALGISLFLLFFKIDTFPFVSLIEESIITRLPKVIWILFVLPLVTFIFMYFYPSLEKRSSELKINQELPFAVIHMSTISGSMIEPSKIFKIIISTKEYPHLEKEFKKLINLTNIYGYDLVTALKDVAKNTPSKKLADLFNSLATTIKSGGDLPDFFNRRSESLLFEYRIEREKYIKFSETFMDIYISTVIAAPMILMLLLMMMKIGGLGIPISSSLISLIMVVGVAIMNVVFLTFLHLKQPGT